MRLLNRGRNFTQSNSGPKEKDHQGSLWLKSLSQFLAVVEQGFKLFARILEDQKALGFHPNAS